MTPAETKSIYEAACRSKRLIPQQEEGEKWHKALKHHESRDVRSGLDAWWSSTDRDSKGDLKSKWLPEPGELGPLAERAMRVRQAAAAEPKVYVGWECSRCLYRCGGFITLDDARLRYCPTEGCNTVMTEMCRERNAA